jgi:hypothetical protein
MQGNWQNIIYNKETIPPPGAWDNIAHKLQKTDNAENWATEIYLKEDTPPPGLWNEIAADLDAASKVNWQTRLYKKEVEPPVDVWLAINAALDAADKKVIVMQPVPANKRNYYRLAAAAALLVAIAGTALWFLGDKPDNTPTTQAVAKATTTNNQVIAPVKEPAEATVPPVAEKEKKEQPVATVTTQQKKPTVVQVDDNSIAPLEYVKSNQMGFLPENPVLSNNKKLPGNNGEVSTDITLMETPANAYISISGPDGQSIRVSSKFTNLIGYLTDGPVKEERLDVIIRESALWKTTFRKWREKMMTNTAAPLPGNFMDVIELGKLLSEK